MRSFPENLSALLWRCLCLTPARGLPLAATGPKHWLDSRAKGLRSVGSERLESNESHPPRCSDVEFNPRGLSRAAQKASGGGSSAVSLARKRCIFEARGETVKGQFAVDEVIMNRVKSRSFPRIALQRVINARDRPQIPCQFLLTPVMARRVIAEPRA